MVDDLTLGKLSAYARTWIFALRLYTSERRHAIGIDNAFRSASFVRITDIIWQTRTRSGTVLFFANSVKTAG